MFERRVDDGHAVGLALRACLGLLSLPAAEFIEASFAEEERLVWWPLTRWWARVFVRVLRAQRSVQRSVRRSRVFVLVPKQPAARPFERPMGLNTTEDQHGHMRRLAVCGRMCRKPYGGRKRSG